MKFYTESSKIGTKKKNRKPLLIILILFVILFNGFFYLFDKRVLPSVLNVGEIKMKSEAIKIINQESVNVYADSFKYDDIVKIEKDTDGNITLIRSDTVKQNELAAEVVLKCDEKLNELGDLGIEVPVGFLTSNSFFYTLGPKIKVKMYQIGNISTTYDSIFEGAGLNQTRHKIYLNVLVKMRVVVPFNSKDVEVTCQIPVSETIIVGKIPSGAIVNSN